SAGSNISASIQPRRRRADIWNRSDVVVLADGPNAVRQVRRSRFASRSSAPNPAAAPTSPGAPRRVIVHFRGVQFLIGHLLLQAKLAVFLILRFLADIEHIV